MITTHCDKPIPCYLHNNSKQYLSEELAIIKSLFRVKRGKLRWLFQGDQELDIEPGGSGRWLIVVKAQ